MVRYIDADKLLKKFSPYTKEWSEIYLTPTADVVEVKQIEKIRADLKWWLKTNTEKGVVYIPKFVVENMVEKMNLSEIPTD